MSTIELSLRSDGFQSSELTELQFGSNMLFHTDRVGEHSDFSQIVQNLGIENIRFPGGTIAEQFFDLQDPNMTSSQNILDIINENQRIEVRSVVPLSDYLSYMRDVGGTPTIVLPTYRYFDQETRQLSTEGASAIRNFVWDLMEGVYGSFERGIFELGNEWYQDNFNWSIEEFGALQAEIATIIDSVLNELGLRDDVDILAQTGQTTTDHETLASFFDESNEGTIDGVLTHLYVTNSNGNPLGMGGGAGNRLDSIYDEWSASLGDDFLLAVTEWNVGESGEDSTLINGIMRLAPLLRLFAEMISSDVDIAHIWATQTRGPAGLSDREGQGSSLSPTGYFFDLVHDGTLGTRMVDNGSSFHIRNEQDEVIGYNYSFIGPDTAVVYLASGIAETSSLDIDMSIFFQPDMYVYLTTITGAPGDAGTGYHSDASLEFVTDVNVFDLPDVRAGFVLELGAYELVQVHISYGAGVSITADAYNHINDYLTGTNYSDTIDGSLGDDTISGSIGDDFLYGGEGADEIFGGSGRDLLEGGFGSDSLFGGAWHDTIYGGEGNDLIDGGMGNDFIVGGAGADTIDGGDGDDLIRPAEGSGYVLGGLGFDTLSFSDVETGISFWGIEQIIEMGFEDPNLPQLQFDEIEVVIGTEFSDRFETIDDNIEIFGGNGDDNFNVVGGTDVLLDMGVGEDTAFVYGNGEIEIFGGVGDDTFLVYNGENTLIGGEGDDHLYLFSNFGSRLEFNANGGSDTVYSFDPSLDTIYFSNLNRDDLTIFGSELGTLISLADSSSIFLANVSDIEDYNFLIFDI